jgi:hypothetical protein
MAWLAPWCTALTVLCLLLASGLAAAPSAPPAAAAVGFSPQAPATQTEPTLLAWSTVERLLGGDVLGGPTPGAVTAAVADFPTHWPVVGVGTTDWVDRNGELMPDGHANALRLWWADPAGARPGGTSDLASPKAGPALGEPRFPFLGLAVGDPARVLTWTVADVDDLHAWLGDRLAAAGVTLAGLQVHGDFGRVQTTVAHWLPSTGLDLSGGYVGDDYFRFGDYAPAIWTLNGLYAGDREVQPIVSAPGAPLHLHGYQQISREGGHITRAAVRDAVVTVWPLERIERRAERYRARFGIFHGERALHQPFRCATAC